MDIRFSNKNNIFSYLKDEENNNCDVSFQCKGGEIKIQSAILFAASNFWKCILKDIPYMSDYQVEVPDIEKHVMQSIISLLYQGCAQNEKNFEAEAYIILPDLVFEITKESPIELLEPFLDTKKEPLMDETTCNFCFKYFARKESCLKHIERMHTKKENFVICEICTGHFKTKEALNIHMKLKHCPEKPQSFECLTCGKSYAQEPSLKRHLRIKKHQFKIPSSTQKTGYQICQICGKEVGRFNYHMEKYHKSETLLFPCNKCDKQFNRKDTLYRHNENVHSTYNYNLPAANKLLKVREKEWKCKTCQKSFHSAWDLENHLVKRNCSEITKPDFSCQYCDKSYKEKHNLNKHIKSKHCSKENVICSICGKVFQQKQSLTRHLKFVH